MKKNWKRTQWFGLKSERRPSCAKNRSNFVLAHTKEKMEKKLVHIHTSGYPENRVTRHGENNDRIFCARSFFFLFIQLFCDDCKIHVSLYYKRHIRKQTHKPGCQKGFSFSSHLFGPLQEKWIFHSTDACELFAVCSLSRIADEVRCCNSHGQFVQEM